MNSVYFRKCLKSMVKSKLFIFKTGLYYYFGECSAASAWIVPNEVGARLHLPKNSYGWGAWKWEGSDAVHIEEWGHWSAQEVKVEPPAIWALGEWQIFRGLFVQNCFTVFSSDANLFLSFEVRRRRGSERSIVKHIQHDFKHALDGRVSSRRQSWDHLQICYHHQAQGGVSSDCNNLVNLFYLVTIDRHDNLIIYFNFTFFKFSNALHIVSEYVLKSWLPTVFDLALDNQRISF